MTVASSHGFVGRGEELARLLAALGRAERGRPAMVLVAGDAGVGKTRLLAELADQARQRGAQVLVGGCVELGDIGVAYLPVVDALHELADDPAGAELLAEVATTAPGIRRLLSLATAPTSAGVQGDGLNQLQVFGAVRALLVRSYGRNLWMSPWHESAAYLPP